MITVAGGIPTSIVIIGTTIIHTPDRPCWSGFLSDPAIATNWFGDIAFTRCPQTRRLAL